MTCLPYIITTKYRARSFMDGKIPFASIIPEEFRNIPNSYPMDYLKLGIKQQLQDRIIVDLSDFSSSALTLFTVKPDERLQQYGDTVIVITRPQKFFQMLNTVNAQLYPNLKYLFASDVIYDDELFEENIANLIINPFIHRSEEAWKQEVIILSRVKPTVILTGAKEEQFIIPDGIRDVAVELDLTSAIKTGLSDYQYLEKEVMTYPMLTGIKISISGNIQDIKPKKVWIEMLRNSFEDNWKPITRIVTSPDGKSEVPCLGFTDGYNTVVFQVNTISFSIAVVPHSGSDKNVHSCLLEGDSLGDITKCIKLVDKVIRCVKDICATSFAYPSIILTSDMGEVTGAYTKNKGFELRRSFEDRGLIHWYGLAINNLVKPGVFGLPQAGKNHWMLREQLVSPDNTLWYDADEILAFFRKAYEDIWAHMNELTAKNIVSKITNSIRET